MTFKETNRVYLTKIIFSPISGKHIFDRGSQNGKRVQSNMGAKNHGVILPDANKESTINALVGAAFGAAGQRYFFANIRKVLGKCGKTPHHI